jgi:hypothetical protein
MKRFLVAALVAVFVVGVVSVPVAFAGKGNPAGTGPPSQDCVELVQTETGGLPGHAESSPGSPFNEEELNGGEGGIGGQHYNEMSQYDVACYHQQ